MPKNLKISILRLFLGLVLEGGCVMATFGKIGASTLVNHKKFARDYIQDGLIALWDAEENIGWNKHSPNPSVWKNLVGNGLDMISNGNPVFYDKYIAPTAVNQLWYTNTTSLFDGCISSGTFTFEVAATPAIYSSQTKALLFGGNAPNNNGAALLFAAADSTRIGITCWVNTTNSVNYGKFSPSATRSMVASAGAFYGRQLRGNVVDVTSPTKTISPPITYTSKRFTIGYRFNNSSNAPSIRGSKYYCFRIYNRALTLAEVKANAVVDQIRFGFA